MLQYVKGLIESDRQRQLQTAGDDEEKIDEINYLTVSFVYINLRLYVDN